MKRYSTNKIKTRLSRFTKKRAKDSLAQLDTVDVEKILRNPVLALCGQTLINYVFAHNRKKLDKLR
jgi:hypothetical protein